MSAQEVAQSVPEAFHEEWRAVVGFEGRYEVSDLGRVRRIGNAPRTPTPNHDGYPEVCFWVDGKVRNFKVHRLVCRAFHGPDNILHNEVAHLDGSRDNARADNLKWASKVENHHHKRLHGTHQAGENHPSAKLTTVQVMQALEMLASGTSTTSIAAMFGVSAAAIDDIKRRRRWRHIVGPREAYRHVGASHGQRMGATNPCAKLTQAQADEIRRRGNAGEKCRDLGKAFGVGHALVNRIVRGEAYRPTPSLIEIDRLKEI